MEMNLNRRSFLGGLAAAIAAPYVVHASILMPVKAIIKPHIYRITEVSIDGENWCALAYLNLKAGRSLNYMGSAKTIHEYAAMTFPHHRVVFAKGWTQ